MAATYWLDHLRYWAQERGIGEVRLFSALTSKVFWLHAACRSEQYLLATLARRFGANRLMWGSDYPQVHNRPYSDLAALARSAAAALPPAEQSLLLAGTIQNFWATY